jgi:hypothetical protein
MNPLLQHPVLKTLPFEQLKSPTVDGIRTFRDKKIKMFARLKWLFVALFFFMLLTIYLTQDVKGVNATMDAFSSVNNIVMLLGSLALAIGSHFQSKKFNLSDEEIKKAVDEFHAQSKVPA